MKRLTLFILLALGLSLQVGCGSVSKIIQSEKAQKADIPQIRKALGAYSDAFYAEDINRLMQSFDRKSPDYLRAKSLFLKAFRTLNLKGNLDSVSLIGTSDKYTFVRLKQKFMVTLPSPIPGGVKRTINAQQDLVFALILDDADNYKIWRVIFLKALEPEELK